MTSAEYQRQYRAKQGARTGQPGRPATEPCGSEPAYRRHLRNGEDTCDACKAAHNEHQAKKAARRRVNPERCGEPMPGKRFVCVSALDHDGDHWNGQSWPRTDHG